MSTRAVIARKTENGFRGVYHHWDGYPTALGATLFGLFNGHFHQDSSAMLKYLIDEHPAGWSTINEADFTLAPGFDNEGAPQCYCHGARKEKGAVYTEKNSAGSGCEWAYVFDGNKMEVHSSYCEDGAKMIGAFGCGDPESKWRTVAIVDLWAPEPNWEKIESRTPIAA